WKEDEIYIKNIIKIYEENENEIRKEHGAPLWEYAMTMDKFDESYLVVPVRRNGRIVEVLEVPRFGRKVYFRYSDDDDKVVLFNQLMTDRPKKPLPASSVNMVSKIVCVVKTFSTWYPDNENNPSGSGHWETSSYTICTDLTIDTFENPDDGGGNVGYDYPPLGGGYENPEDSIAINKTPCEKTKNIVNNSNLKPKIDELKTFSLTAVEDEVGYHQDKSGNVTPADVNGNHHVDFTINQNSLGGIHSHTLNGAHIFSPRDILTLLDFAGVQNQTLPIGSTADNTGNAFLGMISQSGSYFITFNGGSGDLPPSMTQAEEDALIIEMNKTYKNIKRELLKAEGKNMSDDLSDMGHQKLFFDIIKKMGLEGKINLIKENNGNTSTIKQNPDGTIPPPTPC
ncbi:MAG: hypothetical protein AB7E26_12940, partial [Chryseobacterium sp.]